MYTGLFNVITDGIMGKDCIFEEKDRNGNLINKLTIKSNVPFIISGNIEETQGYIVIDAKDANVTLRNLVMTNIRNGSPITLCQNASATFTLEGTNILRSHHDSPFQCGMCVNKGSSVTIKGHGNLEAKGSYYGSGIGGGGAAAGSITIESGNIIVGGGYHGLGGGGLNHGNLACDGGNITIKGGFVYSSNGIGGSDETGAHNSRGTLTLDGDAVVYCDGLSVSTKNLKKGFLFSEKVNGIIEGTIYGNPYIEGSWPLFPNTALIVPKEMADSIKIAFNQHEVTDESGKRIVNEVTVTTLKK